MIQPDFARYLVERFGSPIYTYDLDVLDQRASELLSLLPTGSRLFYSLKANPLPALAEALRNRGCRAEISSPGELRAAQLAGFPAGDMLYGGPGKSPEELDAAITAGVRIFSAESWTDLLRIGRAARDATHRLAVLLRINPAGAPVAQLSMSGVESQFGFEEQALLEHSSTLASLKQDLEIIGLHIYYGTQLDGSAAILAAMQAALQAAEQLADRLPLTPLALDLGGGFPWPYATAGEGPDLQPLRDGLDEMARRRRYTANAELWFESGRYLVASSGVLLTRVLDVKAARGKKRYVVLDTGINHLGGMTGLGRILRPMITLLPIKGTQPSAENDLAPATVVGPLCTPLDCLARNTMLPPLAPGDLLAIPNVGAYGLSASLVHFLSRDPPLEVICRAGRVIAAYRLPSGYEQYYSDRQSD